MGRVRATATERVVIDSNTDIIVARQKGRAVAAKMGFGATDLTLIATAISELARNIVLYARRGEIDLASIANGEKSGIEVVARDEGPGISDIGQAMQGGFSTSGSLGLGLPGVRRLMDEMEIESAVGKGTTVTTRKWR